MCLETHRIAVSSTILLVRHGETEWNLQRRYQGRSDSPLTETGIAQAHTIAALASGLPISVIIASPLGRARRTAELIREHLPETVELRLDDRLRELSLGSWDGLTYQEIARREPGVFDADGQFEWYFRSPDGEPYDAFAGRLADWLGEWGGRGALLVVTHGIVTRVLRGLYAGLPRSVALTLPVRQDRIYRLAGGLIEELAPGAPVHGETPRAAAGRARSR